MWKACLNNFTTRQLPGLAMSGAPGSEVGEPSVPGPQSATGSAVESSSTIIKSENSRPRATTEEIREQVGARGGEMAGRNAEKRVDDPDSEFELLDQYNARTAELWKKNKELVDKDCEIIRIKGETQRKDKKVESLRRIISSKDQTIAILEDQKEQQTNREKAHRVYRRELEERISELKEKISSSTIEYQRSHHELQAKLSAVENEAVSEQSRQEKKGADIEAGHASQLAEQKDKFSAFEKKALAERSDMEVRHRDQISQYENRIRALEKDLWSCQKRQYEDHIGTEKASHARIVELEKEIDALEKHSESLREGNDSMDMGYIKKMEAQDIKYRSDLRDKDDEFNRQSDEFHKKEQDFHAALEAKDRELAANKSECESRIKDMEIESKVNLHRTEMAYDRQLQQAKMEYDQQLKEAKVEYNQQFNEAREHNRQLAAKNEQLENESQELQAQLSKQSQVTGTAMDKVGFRLSQKQRDA